LLAAAATIRSTRTIAKRSPRMVKRRNSNYAPHDRHAPIRVPIMPRPSALPPLDIPSWATVRKRQLQTGLAQIKH
jgi:hypothetical protein